MGTLRTLLKLYSLYPFGVSLATNQVDEFFRTTIERLVSVDEREDIKSKVGERAREGGRGWLGGWVGGWEEVGSWAGVGNGSVEKKNRTWLRKKMFSLLLLLLPWLFFRFFVFVRTGVSSTFLGTGGERALLSLSLPASLSPILTLRWEIVPSSVFRLLFFGRGQL